MTTNNETVTPYESVQLSPTIEAAYRPQVEQVIRSVAQYMSQDYAPTFGYKNKAGQQEYRTPMTPENYKFAVVNVLNRIANQTIGIVSMEQQQQAVSQFIAFATGIQVGSLYHGWHDHRIREATQGTDPAGFVFGLALRESVSGNAIGNMLERADVFPTAKQQLQEPGSLMVTASTSLRDELLVLEGRNMLRGNGTSHWVEDTLAERGVMIPHAWEHMRARLTDRVQNMVRSFVREDKVFPEGTNIAPLERAVVAIVDRYVQQQCGIDQDEPSNGQDAATKARLLKTTDRAVLYGMAGDCSHDMSGSYGMPASSRFAKGRMVDMLTRTASRGPLAGEYELLSAPPGDHALTVVGAIRALLRPVDQSGAYTFRQFAEKMGTTEYFSMDGHSGKEFIGHMRDTLCDAVAEIIGNSPEMKLANIIDSRLDDAMMGARSMSKRLLEKGRAGKESHQRDLAALAQAHATIEEAAKDEPTTPSPQLREAASPEPEKPSEAMKAILEQVRGLTHSEKLRLITTLQFGE